ncbi:hypothetical protein LAJ54_11445 [Streptococcus pneumoniae]|nr:hypothetical protein [Streptococcus pneumoniae]
MKDEYKQLFQEIEEEKRQADLLQGLAKNVESISKSYEEEAVTLEEFKAMGYKRRHELFEKDTALYDKLLGKEKRGL